MEPVALAIAGIGNNASALVQGLDWYRDRRTAPGIRRPVVDGLAVTDVEVVAAFDIDPGKVGRALSEAILLPPNSYPEVAEARSGTVVTAGLTDATTGSVDRIAAALTAARTEVLLYCAPAGLTDAAAGYAAAALRAGTGFVNTTPEVVARDPETLRRFTEAGLPLLGDDLASQFGTSAVHRALLELFADRGITLDHSYQVNLGGNEDFRNLTTRATGKAVSKLNALSDEDDTRSRVHLMPFGYLPGAGDRKRAHVNLTGIGWAGTDVSVDLTLTVHDSSGAAGVTIDLVRFAAGALRAGRGGFDDRALRLVKSPPGTAAPDRD